MIEKYLNTIQNVDCLEFMRGLPDKCIDCIYTDVPYLYQTGGGGSSKLALRIRNNINTLDEHKITDGFDIKTNFLEWIRIMKKINLFVWCSKLQILDLLKEAEKLENVYIEILVWVKTNPTPSTNNTWLPDIEYCLYFREKGVKLNGGYFHKQKAYIGGLNVADKKVLEHPTIKPLDCVQKHLLHATQENDIVFDPYIGSGTTAHACKMLKRKYIGCEISKEYCDIAEQRIKSISNTLF
jgi:site-specific DNA-methyltransferase (adenine-specific)